MKLSTDKYAMIMLTIFLIFYILNLEKLIIDINFVYYALIIGAIIFFIGNINYFITILLIVYPVKTILPIAQNQLFGIIQIDDILLFFIIALFFLKNKNKLIPHKSLDKFVKMAIHFTLFMLAVSLLAHVRTSIVLNINTQDDFYYIKVTLKALLFSSAIIIIILSARNMSTQKAIDNGIFYGTVLMGIVALTGSALHNIGLNINLMDYEYSGIIMERTGAVGLDPNEFAALMLLTLAYFLSRIEQTYEKRNKYIIGCVFALIGILQSGSRAGLIVLSIIFIVFSIRNIKKLKLVIPLIAMLIIVLTIFFSATTVTRLGTLKEEHLNADRGAGRLYRQVTTIKYLINNPSSLIIGANMSIQEVTDVKRNLHNYYLYILYKYGVFVFGIYIIIIYKLVRLEKLRKKSSYSLIYPLLAFFLPLFTVLYSMYFYFPLIIAMAPNNLSHRLGKRVVPSAVNRIS